MNSLTPIQQKQQQDDKICHICGNVLSFEDRVTDHCHLTGEYTGPAHNQCSLKYQELSYFEGDISIIPFIKELNVSLSKRIYVNDEDSIELRFLDSFRFMPPSLQSVASYLNVTDLNIIKSVYNNTNEFHLITRKGVFPYDYLDSIERLKETQLPPHTLFFNKLNDEICSAKDYEHAQKVWNTFKCENLLDYLLLYLKVDV